MDIENLKNFVIFNDLNKIELQEALKALSAFEKKYEKNSIIHSAGTLTDRMGLVLAGSLIIERNDMLGNRTVLSHVGRGEFFAETYALLATEPMLVDVRANDDCHILFIRLYRLKEFLATGDTWALKIANNLLSILAYKNLKLSRRSFHTSPKTIRGRVLAYLTSTSLQKGNREFDIPFDRQQLADYLNLDRTALSKELGKMQREGIISVKKNHFKLYFTENN
ncbi:MAG: Crp/Fnr family transcriptional regulator [Finegoldia sp.]|nr:Crp/Fnr family transcriptional regulator [Finegoldia sp.]